VRKCDKTVKRLKAHTDVFLYIKELARDSELLLAIRENYINIYYMGGSLAKIGFDKQGEVYFEVHEKYLGKSSEGYERLSLKKHKENLVKIKENIKNIAFSNKLQNSKNKKNTREKVCQQWIINQNNTHNSEWYYVDMEYMIKGNPLGRFDMIAIKKKADVNGKHQVALVELKVGSGAYGSTGGMKLGDDSLYNYQTKDTYVSFGSGLVGHLCDYMRYLNTEYYEEMLKEEIVSQIKAFIQMEIVSCDDAIGKIANADMLSDKPEVYFVSFSCVPSIINDTQTSIEQMRESFYKYMYSINKSIKGQNGRTLRCSTRSAEDLLNKTEIKGLLDIKQEFLYTENPMFELEIGQEKYRFHCAFVDAKKKEKAWDCLYE